jgi:peptidoglycan/LPS O-acetylase OafA/YrhL
MDTRIRLFLLIEGIAFALASMVHFGLLIDGYEHDRARIPELVVALVLLGGLVTSLARPDLTRTAGLVAQGFALLGTFVGLFTVAIGVGPQTTPDLVYHLAMVALLIAGLMVTRAMATTERRAP